MTAPDTFRILAVCTGNICRSPAIERLTRALELPDVSVTSAGTRAVVGNPVEPEMADLVRCLGGDPDGFAARTLTADLALSADLVLTAEAHHRARVVSLAPRALRRAFTIREFVRLAEPAARRDRTLLEHRRALVASAAARRRRGTDDDIPDPYRRGRRSYEQAAASIDAVVRELGGVLEPTRS